MADSPHANLIETQCHGFAMLEHLCGPIVSVAAQMPGISDFGSWPTIRRLSSFRTAALAIAKTSPTT